jgi:RNA polymerase sigma factor (sigma-70 family)
MESDRSDGRLLIVEILSGNKSAFKTIIERYQKLVSHIVFRMVSHPTDREDLCQEVFIKVYQNLAGFNFESKLSTWIAQIAYNTCINHLEKKHVPLLDDLREEDFDHRTLGEYPGNSGGPDCEVESNDIAARVRKEIAKMPVPYRAVVTMFHLDEMSYEEIADVTGMPLGTVKSHLFRARQLLKERLTEKYQLEDMWR